MFVNEGFTDFVFKKVLRVKFNFEQPFFRIFRFPRNAKKNIGFFC